MRKATHAGTLTIGEVKIPCAVLDDGTRVISETGIATAFKSRSGSSKRIKKSGEEVGAPIPVFLAAKCIKPFVDSKLGSGPLERIEYLNGNRAIRGYDAKILPTVCEIWLEARQADALGPKLMPKALQAEILMRGLARIGIVALVDEATGYQEERDRGELERLLAAYLSGERLRWARFFPDEFYRQIYRLHGWKWPTGTSKRPACIGQMTNDIVYERLPSGVLKELRSRNPVQRETKRRLYKHTQFLSLDIGQPDLKAVLLQVIALMRASSSWKGFMHLLDRALPKPGSQLRLDIDL